MHRNSDFLYDAGAFSKETPIGVLPVAQRKYYTPFGNFSTWRILLIYKQLYSVSLIVSFELSNCFIANSWNYLVTATFFNFYVIRIVIYNLIELWQVRSLLSVDNLIHRWLIYFPISSDKNVSTSNTCFQIKMHLCNY